MVYENRVTTNNELNLNEANSSLAKQQSLKLCKLTFYSCSLFCCHNMKTCRLFLFSLLDWACISDMEDQIRHRVSAVPLLARLDFNAFAAFSKTSSSVMLTDIWKLRTYCSNPSSVVCSAISLIILPLFLPR